MKKLVIISLAILALPVVALAYFKPATLTNGVTKVAVYSQEKADSLFAKGYVLDTGDKALGAFASPNVMFDAVFHKSIKYKEKTQAIAQTGATSTVTLTALDSGTTYLLSATGTNIYLPNVASSTGAKFRFVINGAIGADAGVGNMVINSTQGDDIEGSVIVAGAVVDCNAADALTFVADGENIGDYVEIMSTGTYWVPLSSGVLTGSKLTCSG